MKIQFLLTAIILLQTHLIVYGQCGTHCIEDFSITLQGCEQPTYVAIDIGSSCVIIFNQAGDIVPNPVPAHLYACQNLKVYKFLDNGDTCVSNFKISIAGNPIIHPIAQTSISAQNFNNSHFPMPRVDDCTPLPHSLEVSTDIIEICNQVPKVKITYTAYDNCGNSSTMIQYFDIIADLACSIVGPSSIPAIKGSEIKSQHTANGFPPFTYNWRVIGHDWKIDPLKGDPSKAMLIPGLQASQVTVQLDLFDRYGCLKTCVKQFSAIRNTGKLELRESESIEPVLQILNQEIRIRTHVDKIITDVQILNSSGKIVQTFNNKLKQAEYTFPIEQLNVGIYILRLKSNTGLKSVKFSKLW